MKSLTQEEVDKLPDKTVIVVKWSGGNGPWRYTLRKTEYGNYVEDTVTGEINYGAGELDFVGKDKPFTRVWVE